MAKELFANTATTTLAAALTDTSGTSVSVVSSTGFPAAVTGTSQFRIRVGDELMIVTNVSGTTWTVTRGAESSTAATHLIASPVYHIATAGSLGVLQQIPASVNASPPANPATNDLWLVTDAAPASNKWTAAANASPPSSPATNDLWLVTDLGADLTAPTDGGIVYGDGSNYQVTAAGTAGQGLVSQGAGIPTWQGTPWTDYSASQTWSLLTLGNGTVVSRYCVHPDGTVIWRGRLTWGSTTSASGFFFPVAPIVASAGATATGTVWGFDSSATSWAPGVFAGGSYFLSGTTGALRWTATVPWTWATGDIINWTMTYEAA